MYDPVAKPRSTAILHSKIKFEKINKKKENGEEGRREEKQASKPGIQSYKRGTELLETFIKVFNVLVTLKLQPVHIPLFFYNKIITNDFYYYYYKHIYKRFLQGGLGSRRNISEQIVYPENPILNRPLLHLSHRLSTTFHLQRMSPYKRRKRIGYS